MATLRDPLPRVLGINPLLLRAGQAAVVAATAWLLQTIQRRGQEAYQYQLRAGSTTDALYRRTDPRTLTDAQLKQLYNHLNSKNAAPLEGKIFGPRGVDYDYNPLTGIGAYRPDIEKELLRRSGNGGFIFIKPDIGGIDTLTKIGISLIGASEFIGANAGSIGKVISDAWGWLNSRFNSAGAPTLDPLIIGKISGTLPPVGNTVSGTLNLNISDGSMGVYGLENCTAASVYGNQGNYSTSFAEIVQAAVYTVSANCGIKEIGLEYYYASSPTIRRVFPFASTSIGFSVWTRNISTTWLGPNPRTYVEPTGEPLPEPDGFFQPEVIPKPATLPALPPAPKPQPITTPVPLPETEPTPEQLPTRPPTTVPPPWPAVPEEPGPVVPGPGPSPTPWEPGPTAPPRPPVPDVAPKKPVEPKETTRILPDGTRAPQTQPQPQPTPDNVKTIGPVMIVSNPPAPTLEGLATELGFIESKLEKLLNPGTAPQIPWLSLLNDLLNLLSILNTGTTYTMTEVCPPNGAPPSIREWEVGGVPLVNLGVASRLDALAEMLQEHKNLKQPVCRTVPSGQPVQVHFIQSEESWEPPP